MKLKLAWAPEWDLISKNSHIYTSK
jgi:hypothetical protein